MPKQRGRPGLLREPLPPAHPGFPQGAKLAPQNHRIMGEYFVFLDESGDDNLVKPDPRYPLFVLVAVAIEKEYHNTTALREFAEFKSRYMTPGQVLHTVDMVRNQKGFQFLQDPARREAFYQALNDLIARTDFTLIAALLDIPAAVARWGVRQRTPYVYLMQLLLERVYFLLRGKGTAQVFAECRQPQLDALIEAEFSRVRNGATMIRPASLMGRLFPEGIRFLPKSANPGAELADLLATPVGRYHLGRPSPISEEVVQTKLYRRPADGQVNGWGRIVQP